MRRLKKFLFFLSRSRSSVYGSCIRWTRVSAAYNMPVAFRLSGQLDVEALQWSLNEIVRRHEILRTTFDVLDQQPVQLIAATGNLTLALTDLSSLPAAGERS